MALATGITYPNNGDRIKVENYNTSIQKIVAQLNGNLDDANIISLSGTKLTAGTVPLTALNTAATTSLAQGWNTLSNNPNTVTYLGNRSYSLVFNAVDLTSTISPGYRLRTTRTVAAPTQSTSLNGTTQFYSKTSPAGMTFTDDFVASAWVKLSSYSSYGTIVSRFNGTSGWELLVDGGQVVLIGRNAGGGNYSQIKSYQSIPLNRWVHISAQLDMSAFTASTTTSYIMIDGVDVPGIVSRGGTNPTALIQAGNLEIGSENSGTFPFPGKIAQAAIFNSKVTQATMQGYISQGLLGTETSIISAYSFNNTINDLNTTTANNLTANGSAVATNADSPFGTQASGLISATLDYAIVQTATFSTNTTVIVQVPEGCTIPTSGGVTTTSYSNTKSPYGFPTTRRKWQTLTMYAAQESVSIASINNWFASHFQLNIPIGEWIVSTQGELSFDSSVSGIRSGFVALAATTPTALASTKVATGTFAVSRIVSLSATTAFSSYNATYPIALTSATPYILYAAVDTVTGTENYTIHGEQQNSFIVAENAYL